MREIKIFSPATVANISCGFDILGLCLDTVGDEMVVREVAEKGVKITHIIGQNLPFETKNNVAGVAALALLENIETSVGYEIEIYNAKDEDVIVEVLEPVPGDWKMIENNLDHEKVNAHTAQ